MDITNELLKGSVVKQQPEKVDLTRYDNIVARAKGEAAPINKPVVEDLSWRKPLEDLKPVSKARLSLSRIANLKKP